MWQDSERADHNQNGRDIGGRTRWNEHRAVRGSAVRSGRSVWQKDKGSEVGSERSSEVRGQVELRSVVNSGVKSEAA